MAREAHDEKRGSSDVPRAGERPMSDVVIAMATPPLTTSRPAASPTSQDSSASDRLPAVRPASTGVPRRQPVRRQRIHDKATTSVTTRLATRQQIATARDARSLVDLVPAARVPRRRPHTVSDHSDPARPSNPGRHQIGGRTSTAIARFEEPPGSDDRTACAADQAQTQPSADDEEAENRALDGQQREKRDRRPSRGTNMTSTTPTTPPTSVTLLLDVEAADRRRGRTAPRRRPGCAARTGHPASSAPGAIGCAATRR